MTEADLISVLFCICSKLSTQDAKVTCMEQYVNCAVRTNGKILSVKDFDEQCHQTPGQARCYPK